jgi:hypothetical protein
LNTELGLYTSSTSPLNISSGVNSSPLDILSNASFSILDKESECWFYHYGSTFVEHGPAWGKYNEYKKKLIEKYGKPKFIKIVVEGYELNVLKGLTQPIEFISIEFNPELCKETVKCIEYLEELNNECLYNYGYRNNEHFKFENWISKQEIVSYLQSINDFKFEFGDVYCKNVISKV